MTERETIELTFDVDAALLVELGERLVARRSTALAELIKNAYDADATQVIVSFENMGRLSAAIVVMDDGTGMSFEKMKQGWMRIATNDAIVNARSARFDRIRTGAKGVGRFACGRLAYRLYLESISHVSGIFERITADFNWRDFEPGQDLSEVTAQVTRELLSQERPTGTTLRLSHLVDDWTSEDMDALQAELDDLIDFNDLMTTSRQESETTIDPGFGIQILAPDFPDYEGLIGEKFKDTAWGVLTGSVSGEGIPRYELDIQDSNIHREHHPLLRSFSELSNVEFTVRMMVYEGSRFRGSGYSLPEARTLGRKRGGVRIYLDGFQVFSYGLPGDDWLDLDQDRARRLTATPNWLTDEAGDITRPMLSLPGNMQLFGSVAISREHNPGLSVSISREQFVQNSSFTQLKTFVRDGIDWMTVCYARERAKQRNARKAAKATTITAAQALQSVRDYIDGEESVSEYVRQTLKILLDETETLLTEETKSHLSELSMLRVLASAGTTVLVFDHTLRAMAEQLETIVDRLSSSIGKESTSHVAESRQSLDDLRSWSTIAIGQGSLVGLLLGPKARTRRRSLAVHPLVEELKRGFDGYASRFGIDLSNNVEPSIRTPSLYEAEVYAVLLNLLINSFKAVRDCKRRQVYIDASSHSDRFVLTVGDTGIGIPMESRRDVFEPFYTTSQPDPVLGVGTGLGLKIVRDLVYGWGGTAEFLDGETPWRTVIEIVIPKEAS